MKNEEEQDDEETSEDAEAESEEAQDNEETSSKDAEAESEEAQDEEETSSKDDESDESDEAQDEEETSEDDESKSDDGEAEPISPEAEQPKHRILRVTVLALCVLMVLAYCVNVYLNVRVAGEVREHCSAEDQRLFHTINEATEDRVPALDWMISLYRARRRYARELCDETVLQLSWWRWNLGRRIEADVSEHSQEEISRALGRASLSCEHEIGTMEEVLERELDARGSGAEVRSRTEEMIEGQRESCQELQAAVVESRPGFWPPLIASGQLDVPDQMRAMMPRALLVIAQTEEEAQ